MCTRYISPEVAAMERHWHVGRNNPWRWPETAHEAFPNYMAPFIRAARAPGEPDRELVVGQWSLIPWFAKEVKQKYATANARSEELADKASYKLPWARGQRCIIPAESFFEPNWETGKHIPWRFSRADGGLLGLAGLWNAWTDRVTGEVHESYTMLTLNADHHPLMNRMHRPDPKRPPNMRDKRSVVPISLDDVDTWLHGAIAEAASLIAPPDVELLAAGPG